VTDRAPDHHSFEMDDGAYLIGALSPQDRAEYESHLRVCPSCARSLSELAGLPGLLGRVPAEVAAAMEDPAESEFPPASLLSGVLDRVRSDERLRRRRRLRVLMAVAAVSVLVVAIVVGGLVRSGNGPVAPPRVQAGVELVAVTNSPLTVTAKLTPVRWGTRITLLCSYSGGRSPESTYGAPTYALVVKNSRGFAQQVGTWAAVPGRTITVEAATAMSSDDIATIEVDTSDGSTLLRAVN
jgi:hypothetical protein